jgi:exopolysaccharide production protein ExoZ
VITYHAFQWIDDRFWVGAAGVDVFFVISGFIIWTVASEGEARAGVFFWRRLTRVAPAYWVATGAVILVALAWPTMMRQVTLSPAHIALSLAFIQHIDPRGLPFPVLPPGWSLDYEAVFYALVTLVLLAPVAVRFRLMLAALAAVIAFGVMDPPAYYLGANMMLLQFGAGVCLARRARLGRRTPPLVGAALVAGGVALLAAMGLTGVRSDLWRPILWGAPATLIVAGALALEPLRRLAPPKALLRLGDASYAVYLCHFVAVAAAARLVGVAIWPFVPLAILLSLAAGIGFHHAVERPLIAGARALPGLFAAARARLAPWPTVRLSQRPTPPGGLP